MIKVGKKEKSKVKVFPKHRKITGLSLLEKILPIHHQKSAPEGLPEIVGDVPLVGRAMEGKGSQEMLSRLFVAADVDAADAEVVSCPDKRGFQAQCLVVCVDRLFAPSSVGQCRSQSVPDDVVLLGFVWIIVRIHFRFSFCFWL